MRPRIDSASMAAIFSTVCMFVFASGAPAHTQDSEEDVLIKTEDNVVEAGGADGISKQELTAVVEQAVAKRIRPLERELRSLKEEVRFHDILGGIGYIAGIAGVTFYFLGVRKRERRDREPE